MNTFIDITDITETTLFPEDILIILNGDDLREYFKSTPDSNMKKNLLELIKSYLGR